MQENTKALPGQCVLMLAAALNALKSVEGEPDIRKVRKAVAATEGILTELLGNAEKAYKETRRTEL